MFLKTNKLSISQSDYLFLSVYCFTLHDSNKIFLSDFFSIGNIWGRDETGKMCMGCGHQEMFINCADISIKGWTSDVVPAPTAVYNNDSSVTIFQSDTSSQDDSSSNFETQTAIPPPPPDNINNTSNHEDHSPRIPRPPPADYFLDAQEQDNPSAVTAPPKETQHNKTAKLHDGRPDKPVPLQSNIPESSGITHEYGHVTSLPFFDGQLAENASFVNNSQTEVTQTFVSSRDKPSVSAHELTVFPIGPKGHLHQIAAKNEHHKLFPSSVDILSELSKAKPARFSDVPITTVNEKQKLATKMQNKYSELSPLEAEMTYQFPLQNDPLNPNTFETQRSSNTKEKSVLPALNVKKLEKSERSHFPDRQWNYFKTTTAAPTVYQEMFTLRTSVYPKHNVEHKLHSLDHDHSKPPQEKVKTQSKPSFTDKDKTVIKKDNLPTLPYLSKTSKLSASDHAALFREMSFMKPSPFLYPPSKLEINRPSPSSSETSMPGQMQDKPIHSFESKGHQSKQNDFVLTKIRQQVNSKIPGGRISRQKAELQSEFKEMNKANARRAVDRLSQPSESASSIQVDTFRNGKQINTELGKPKPEEITKPEVLVDKTQQSSDIIAPSYSTHQDKMPVSETNADGFHSQTDFSKSPFEIRIYNQNEQRQPAVDSVQEIPHNILSESKVMISDNYQKIHEINSGWGTPLTTSDVLTKSGTISKLLKAQEMVNYAHDHIVPEPSDQIVMKPATINSDVTSLKTNRSDKPSSLETAGKMISVKNIGEAQKMVDYAHEHIHVPNLMIKDTSIRNSIPMATSNQFDTSNKVSSTKTDKVSKSKASNVVLHKPHIKLKPNTEKQERQFHGGALNNKLRPLKPAIGPHGQTDQRTASVHHKQSVTQTKSRNDISKLHSDTLRSNVKMHHQSKVNTVHTVSADVQSSASKYAKAQDVDLSNVQQDNTGPVYKTFTKINVNHENKQSQAFQHLPTLKPSNNQPLKDTAFHGHHQTHVSDENVIGKSLPALSHKIKSTDIQPHKNTQLLANGQQQEQNKLADVEHKAFADHSHMTFTAKDHHHTNGDNMHFKNNFESVNTKAKGSKSDGKQHSKHKHTQNIPDNNLNSHDNGDNGFSQDQKIQGHDFPGLFHDTNSNAHIHNEHVKSNKNVDHTGVNIKPAIRSDFAAVPKVKNLKGVQSLQQKTHMTNIETHPETSVSHKLIADTKAQPEFTSIMTDITPSEPQVPFKHSQIDGSVKDEIYAPDTHKHLPVHEHTAHEHHIPQKATSKLGAHTHSFKTKDKLPQSSNVQADRTKEQFQTSVTSASRGSDLTRERLAIHEGSDQKHAGLQREVHSAGIMHTAHDSTRMQDKKHRHLAEIIPGKMASTQNAHHHLHDLPATQKIKGPEIQRTPAKDLHMHDHAHTPNQVAKTNTIDIHTKGKSPHTHKKDTFLSTPNFDSLSADSLSTEPHTRKSAQATNIHDVSNHHAHMPHDHGHAESERHAHAHTRHPQSELAKLRRENKDNGNLNHHRDHTLRNVHGDHGSSSTNAGTQLHTTHISPHDHSMFLNDGFNPIPVSEVSHVAKVPESSHMLDHGPHEHNNVPQINDIHSLLGAQNEQVKKVPLIDGNAHHHLHDHAHPPPHTHEKQDWTASIKKTTIDDFVNRLTSHMESNINQTVSQGHDTHIKVLPLSKETIIQVLQAIAQGSKDTSTVLSSHVSGSKADKVSHTDTQRNNIPNDHPTETFNHKTEKVAFDNSNSPTNTAERLATTGMSHTNIDHDVRQISNSKKDLHVTDLTSSKLNPMNNDRSPNANRLRNLISSDTAITKNLKSERVVETGVVSNAKEASRLLDLTTVTVSNKPDRLQILRSIDTSTGLDTPPALKKKSGSVSSMDHDRQPHPSSQQDTLESPGIAELQASRDSQSSSNNKLKERIASLWRKPSIGISNPQASKPSSRQGDRDLPRSSNRFESKVPFQKTEQKPISPPKGSVARLTRRPTTSNKERPMPEYFPPLWRERTADRQTNVRTGSQTNVRQRTFQDRRQRQNEVSSGIQWHNRPPLALRGFRGQPFSPRQAFMSSRLPTDEIRRIPQRQSRTRARSNGRQSGRQLRTNPRLSETQINNRGLVQRSRSSERRRTQTRFRPTSSRSSRRFESSRRGQGRASTRRRFGDSFFDSNTPRSRGFDTIQRIQPNNNRRVMFVGSPEGAQRVISNRDLGRGKDALRKMRRLITQSEHRSAARGDPRRRIVVLPLNRKTVSRIFGEMGARRQR